MFSDAMCAAWIAYCKANGIDPEIRDYFVWLAGLPQVSLYDDASGRWYLQAPTTDPTQPSRLEIPHLIQHHGPAVVLRTLHEDWPVSCRV